MTWRRGGDCKLNPPSGFKSPIAAKVSDDHHDNGVLSETIHSV